MKMLVLIGSLALAAPALAATPEGSTPWSMNATIIEACSCPMFCQCYFNAKPAGHVAGASAHAGHEGMSHGEGAEHFCRANNAFRVNKGTYGKTKLDGAKFWAAMDLGDEFSDGEMEWLVLSFDPAVTPEQREGILAILPHVYPVKFKSMKVNETAMPIEWTATRDKAVAKLDGGKAAEVELARFPGMTSEPVVIRNLKYWGVPRNDGFVMMPNTIEAWRGDERAFEFKGTNGFMITFDITSKDVATKGS